jgi:hypothetical protein
MQTPKTGGVRQVVLQTAQARHSERRALARSEPTCGLESTQACALLNEASGVLLCLGTGGL